MSNEKAGDSTFDSERSAWQEVENLLEKDQRILSNSLSVAMRSDLSELANKVSRYKACSRLVGTEKNVLELNCGDGAGSLYLAEFSSRYIGIDDDASAVQRALKDWGKAEILFHAPSALTPKLHRDNHASIDTLVCVSPSSAFMDDPGKVLCAWRPWLMAEAKIILVLDPKTDPTEKARTALELLTKTVFTLGFTEGSIVPTDVGSTQHLILVGCDVKGE